VQSQQQPSSSSSSSSSSSGFNPKTLKRWATMHAAAARGEVRKCSHCWKDFSSQWALDTHIQTPTDSCKRYQEWARQESSEGQANSGGPVTPEALLQQGSATYGAPPEQQTICTYTCMICPEYTSFATVHMHEMIEHFTSYHNIGSSLEEVRDQFVQTDWVPIEEVPVEVLEVD